jgi:hypothetical protein
LRRRKEMELAELLTSRERGIFEEDLQAHKAAMSDAGDMTARAPTSRRATAAVTRGGRRSVRAATPNGTP